MKKLSLAVVLALASVSGIVAQQGPADAPASKEDIQRYLDAMHSREMMRQMVEAMIKPMHQMVHEQYIKDKNKLPADFEDRLNKMLDDQMNSYPWDQLLDAMIPVYQQHLTKGNVDALVVFYSSPTGKKMLKELPEIMGEAMQATMPIMQKQLQGMTERMQQQIAEITKESKHGQAKKAEPVSN